MTLGRLTILVLCGTYLISTAVTATPILGHRHARQGLPEVLLEALVPKPQDDTSHISDYTHQPKANSMADAPKRVRGESSQTTTTANPSASANQPGTPNSDSPPSPPAFQLEKLGVIASSIGSLFKAAPNLIQNAVKNHPILQQKTGFFARNANQELENEITSDLTTTSVSDMEDIESLEDTKEEKEATTTASTSKPVPPTTTTPVTTTPAIVIQSLDSQVDGNIFTRLLTTVKSGYYLIKTVIVPPKHDPKAIEPPNTAFVTALENVMAFLQPLLGRVSNSRRKRETGEEINAKNDDHNREMFYKLIERAVLDRFRFDSDVQALQAKIIFRESFSRYAGINLITELTEERIQHIVAFLRGLNEYRDKAMSPNDDSDSDNSLPQKKTHNSDINFGYFERSASSESIFILFVEVLGTIAGLSWGSFSQFLWLISNMN